MNSSLARPAYVVPPGDGFRRIPTTQRPNDWWFLARRARVHRQLGDRTLAEGDESRASAPGPAERVAAWRSSLQYFDSSRFAARLHGPYRSAASAE